MHRSSFTDPIRVPAIPIVVEIGQGRHSLRPGELQRLFLFEQILWNSHKRPIVLQTPCLGDNLGPFQQAIRTIIDRSDREKGFGWAVRFQPRLQQVYDQPRGVDKRHEHDRSHDDGPRHSGDNRHDYEIRHTFGYRRDDDDHRHDDLFSHVDHRPDHDNRQSGDYRHSNHGQARGHDGGPVVDDLLLWGRMAEETAHYPTNSTGRCIDDDRHGSFKDDHKATKAENRRIHFSSPEAKAVPELRLP